VTSGFFSTLGVTIRAGRGFSVQDSRASQAAIVNESLAKRLFDGVSPVGRRIWIGGTAHDVIGVAADYAMTPAQMAGAHPKVFLPIASGRRVRGAFFLVRAAGDPAGLVDPVRHRMRDVAPATVVSSAYTFDQTIDVMEQEMLVGTAPLFPLVAIGSLLTTAGIYGVLAFALARRSRELAVRMAMGATGRDVVRLLAGQTMWLAGCGVTLGVGLMFVLSRIGRAAGGGSGVFDFSAATFLVPVAAIFALAAAASVVPSRRARHIDPAVLLRDA
jgi:hypothetical protein